MGNFLASLPKWILVGGALVVGLFFIWVLNPPFTVCQAQIETFKKVQTPFLFLDKEKKFVQTSGWERALETCKVGNSPGACFVLFKGLRELNSDLQTVSGECLPKVGGLKEVRKAYWESVETILRIAWGEKIPSTMYEKLSWLDSSSVSVFCRLKEQIKNRKLYPETKWNEFRERMFVELPGAKDAGRKQAWNLSLFSISCANF